MKKTAVIFLAVAAGWFSGCSKKPAPVELKLKWVAGKRYQNHLVMTQFSRMDVPGAPSPLQLETAMSEDIDMIALKDLPGGAMQMEMAFRSLKLQNKQAGRVQLDFDSSADPSTDEKTAAPLRQLIGAHFPYELDAGGRPGNVNGVDEFLTNLKPGDPQGIGTLRNMITADVIKQMARRSQGLPEKPVAVGEHWPMHLDESAGPVGILQMDMKYTFTGWEDHDGRKCAVIEFIGDMATKPGTSVGAVSLSVEKGTIQGTNWFDPELKMMVETTADQDMQLKFIAQGKTIPSLMKQKLTMKLTGVVDAKK